MAESKFDKLSGSIQKKEGISEERADAIAAAAGRAKYGQKEMTRRAKIGIKRAKKGK